MKLLPTYQEFNEAKSKISAEFVEILDCLKSKKSSSEEIYDCIIRTAVTKYRWNKKIEKLSKGDIDGIVAVQKLVNTKYPEYNYLLDWKTTIPDELKTYI
jgi:hypothetical protein